MSRTTTTSTLSRYALVWEGRELIGHDSVVMRRLLLHGGRVLRTGHVPADAGPRGPASAGTQHGLDGSTGAGNP
jgi:hypothetical protein